MLRHAEGPLLVSSPVLGEIGYLLQSRVGPQAEVTFLKSFGDDGFHTAELEGQDILRMAGLVETYIDLPLGIVDAAVIAIAERLRLTEIARHSPSFQRQRLSNNRRLAHHQGSLTDPVNPFGHRTGDSLIVACDTSTCPAR